MQEDYCFKCGAWARLDEISKLCRICYEAWPCGQRPSSAESRG
jgi:hypothetical protein